MTRAAIRSGGTRKVVEMWDGPVPREGVEARGFPILPDVEHHTIFSSRREDGAYNHHPKIALHPHDERDGSHKPRFHAMWSNHPHGEDGPGQRVLYASSPNGVAWSDPTELFPPPGPVKGWHDTGLAHTALRWLVHAGKLYAVAALHANIGFTDFDNTLPPVPRRDAEHPSRARRGWAPMARCVKDDGTLGPMFPLFDNVPEELACRWERRAETARAMAEMLSTPEFLPNWDFEGRFAFPVAFDGHRLCEPTTCTDADGRAILLARDTAYSHRMYRSLLDEETGLWRPGEPTDIPDSPSLSTTLALADGTVLLIGNQCAPAFDNWDRATHYVRDPLTVAVSPDGKRFVRAFALRHGPHNWNVPQGEVGGRGAGYQYPDAVVSGERLWVIHSVGKERIAISTAPLGGLTAR